MYGNGPKVISLNPAGKFAFETTVCGFLVTASLPDLHGKVVCAIVSKGGRIKYEPGAAT